MRACVLTCFSRVWLFVALWTVAYKAPLSVGFSRQESWSRLLCPAPRDLPNPGTELTSLMSPGLAGRFFTSSATWEAHETVQGNIIVQFKNGCYRDFLGNPVVKTSPPNAGIAGSIPGQGARISHAWGPKTQNIKQYCNNIKEML